MIEECIPKESPPLRIPGKTVCTGKPWMITLLANSTMNPTGSVLMNLGAPNANTSQKDQLRKDQSSSTSNITILTSLTKCGEQVEI
jgi:hypothetical protein